MIDDIDLSVRARSMLTNILRFILDGPDTIKQNYKLEHNPTFKSLIMEQPSISLERLITDESEKAKNKAKIKNRITTLESKDSETKKDQFRQIYSPSIHQKRPRRSTLKKASMPKLLPQKSQKFHKRSSSSKMSFAQSIDISQNPKPSHTRTKTNKTLNGSTTTRGLNTQKNVLSPSPERKAPNVPLFASTKRSTRFRSSVQQSVVLDHLVKQKDKMDVITINTPEKRMELLLQSLKNAVRDSNFFDDRKLIF
jgi:hypothetical protein